MAEPEFKCRTCRKAARPGDPNFPFCSHRCKMIDLGAWLDEDYRISRPLESDESKKEPEREEDEP